MLRMTKSAVCLHEVQTSYHAIYPASGVARSVSGQTKSVMRSMTYGPLIPSSADTE